MIGLTGRSERLLHEERQAWNQTGLQDDSDDRRQRV